LSYPNRISASLRSRGWARGHLGAGYDVETHFNPRYNPWDQGLCLVPDADLFRAIKAGKAEVVTDRIERFTESGLRLQSGQEPRRVYRALRDMADHAGQTPSDLMAALLTKAAGEARN
jgi:cation diffusion facilitator CzcD-associated flavoprotein CzcO